MTLYPPTNLSRPDQMRWLREHGAFDHWGRLNANVRIDGKLHTKERDLAIWYASRKWEHQYGDLAARRLA